ncbi:hypothetical protein [Legionella cardiaca]|uniref:SidC homolog n=1 Tax=Legionella cardiaca TaxID=1071983 RepID=A0ABY8AMY4_9GAMM|nr:hypothetical protein [Legionella cardiaca]WED42048.1 hypothetical protein PXX05_08890 [Legionella cardiaca]
MPNQTKIPDLALWLVGDNYLNNNKLRDVFLSSKIGASFFQPHVHAAGLIKLIHHANYQEIVRVITQDPSLMFTHVHSDEYPKKISPLKYVIKILDTDLLNVFFNAIKDNNQYLSQFLQQAEEQKEYINFPALFAEYEEFFKIFDAYRSDGLSEDALKAAYARLGLSQREHLPIYLIQLMCHPQPWWGNNPRPPMHTLSTQRQVLNANTRKEVFLLPYKPNEGLGYDFAFISIFSYLGVIEEGDDYFGTLAKGLFEVHMQDLSFFQTREIAKLQQIIQNARKMYVPESELDEEKLNYY